MCLPAKQTLRIEVSLLYGCIWYIVCVSMSDSSPWCIVCVRCVTMYSLCTVCDRDLSQWPHNLFFRPTEGLLLQ